MVLLNPGEKIIRQEKCKVNADRNVCSPRWLSGTLILTNRRLIFLEENKEIEYEIWLNWIRSLFTEESGFISKKFVFAVQTSRYTYRFLRKSKSGVLNWQKLLRDTIAGRKS